MTILLFSLLLAFAESLTISFCSTQNTGEQNGASMLYSYQYQNQLTNPFQMPGHINPMDGVQIHVNPDTHMVLFKARIVSARTMHQTKK